MGKRSTQLALSLDKGKQLFDRVARIVGRIDLSRFVSPIRIECSDDVQHLDCDPRVEVTLSMPVLNVVSGFPTTVHQTIIIRDLVSEQHWERYVVSAVRRGAALLLAHEIDECLFFDGRQVRDPHADEKGRAAKLAETARISGG